MGSVGCFSGEEGGRRRKGEGISTYINPFDILRLCRHSGLLVSKHKNTPRRRNVGWGSGQKVLGMLFEWRRVLLKMGRGEEEATKSKETTAERELRRDKLKLKLKLKIKTRQERQKMTRTN